MNVVYSDHALTRMRERGITSLEIEHVIDHPERVWKSGEVWIAHGSINARLLDVVFAKTENYIRIVTVW